MLLRPSRRLGALGAAACFTALAAPAAAHVAASPPWVRAGATSALALDVPNERAVEMVAFDVAAPSGIALLDASGPPGWDARVHGATATWQGRLAPRSSVVVRLEARGRGEPGAVVLRATQRFSDGRSARWSVPLTVLPSGPGGSSLWWEEAAAALAVAVALSLGALVVVVRARRSTLQDR